jgi:hypothetical protein
MGQLSLGQVHCFLTLLPLCTYDNEQYESRLRVRGRRVQEGTGRVQERAGGYSEGSGGYSEGSGGCREGAGTAKGGWGGGVRWVQGESRKSKEKVQGDRREDA